MIPVICDYLKVTFPKGEDERFRDDLSLFLADYAFEKIGDDYYQFAEGGIRLGRHGQVTTLSVSGGVLAELRGRSEYDQFLAMIFDYEHRVTLIDAAYDVAVPDSGSLLRRVYREASQGMHRLSRKSIDPRRHLSKYFSPGDDGKDTGTVYLGVRGKSEVYCKIYDKRKERIDNGRVAPDRPLVRYELSVTGKYAPTLRDAFDPTSLFWRFMGKTLLQSPPELAEWVGMSEGYELPKRTALEPYQALMRRIERSDPELRELARLAALCGPLGARKLSERVTSLCDEEIALKSSDALSGLSKVS